VGVPSNTQIPDTERWTVGEAEKTGSQAVAEATGCPQACIEHQVKKGHEEMGIKSTDEVRPSTAGGEEEATGVGYED
jgi:hypothetical protein